MSSSSHSPGERLAAAALGALVLCATPRAAAATGPHADARTPHADAPAPAPAPETHADGPAPAAAPAAVAPNPAPEPPPIDLTEQAKQLFLLGAEAFGAQRNADAIRYFRKAARLVPSPKLIYNIALAYDEMGDSAHALAEYRSFLAQEPDSEHRANVERRIDALEHQLTSAGVQLLTVSSAPPGALVQVGGENVGVTPWSGELAPGVHQVRLVLEGYQTRQSEVAISAEHPADVTLELAQLPQEAGTDRAERAHIQPLTWSLLGIGVGALTAGTVFELSRAASSRDAAHAASPTDAAEARGAAHAKQMSSLLLLGAGGGFAIAGSVLLVLDLSQRDAQPDAVSGRASSAGAARGEAQLGVPCTPEFCGVIASGHF
jgi:tetratricopeptide (TPR) repeat protein